MIAESSSVTTLRRNQDCSFSPSSTDTELMDWATTPPSSPEDTTRRSPETEESSIRNSLSKMSINFITSRSRCESDSSTSSTRSSPEQGTVIVRTGTQLPLPSFEKLVSNMTTTSPPFPALTMTNIPSFIPPSMTRSTPSSPTTTPRTSPSPRRRETRRLAMLVPHALPTPPSTPANSTHAQPKPRANRHQYDLEEKYALVYFRGFQALKWSEVLQHFRRLFPNNIPRRCHALSMPVLCMSSKSAKSKVATEAVQRANLSPNYGERSVGALECKYYRVRAEEGLPEIRKVKEWRPTMAERAQDRMILDGMEKMGMIGEGFLRMMRESEGLGVADVERSS